MCRQLVEKPRYLHLRKQNLIFFMLKGISKQGDILDLATGMNSYARLEPTAMAM